MLPAMELLAVFLSREAVLGVDMVCSQNSKHGPSAQVGEAGPPAQPSHLLGGGGTGDRVRPRRHGQAAQPTSGAVDAPVGATWQFWVSIFISGLSVSQLAHRYTSSAVTRHSVITCDGHNERDAFAINDRLDVLCHGQDVQNRHCALMRVAYWYNDGLQLV